jgi:spermidine/putrescine transport system ATP-binding protein
MQYELKQLQKQLGITFIYITHDQEEALTMSDRIAVMRNGVIEQIDSAEEIYNKPKTAFAARFVGGANVLYGRIKAASSFSDKDGEKISFCFEHPAGSAKIEIAKSEANIDIQEGKQIMIALREENVSFLPRLNASSPAPAGGLYAVVTGKSFSAGLLRIFAQLDNSVGQEIKSSVQGINSELKTGDRVIVSWKPSNAVLLERE